MDFVRQILRQLRKRLVLGVVLAVVAAGVRTGMDVVRAVVVGTPATIPTEAKRTAAMDSARVKAMAEPLVLDGAAPLERQLPFELRNQVRSEIEPWVLAWRVPRPNFRLDQLAKTDTRPLDAEQDPEPALPSAPVYGGEPDRWDDDRDPDDDIYSGGRAV